MVRLEVLDGQDAGKTEVGSDSVSIGRRDSNQLAVGDWHVSGEHALVFLSGDHWVVRDLQSTNGTRIVRDGTIIPVADTPAHEARLENRDELLIGDSEHPVRIRVALADDEEDAQIVSVRSVTEFGKLEASFQEDADILRGLYAAQKQIGSPLALEEVIDAVAENVFSLVGRATHMTMVLREEDAGETRGAAPRYVAVGSRARGAERGETIPIARSIFRKVIAERAAVLAADARKDVGDTASIMGAKILSTIAVPLWRGDDILGVLQVDNRASSGVFRDRDLDIVGVLAQTASQAIEHARLIHRLRVAEERQRKENSYLKKQEEHRRVEHIIGESRPMKELFEQLRKVVDTRVTVLIEGETGTGKELVASAVHYWSNRRNKLLVVQNCAALPENLLESELFGHKKGAFTGATDDKKGLFELADQGTMFLDEIGEMPPSLQAKLLRVLQEGEVRPVGGSHTRKVDVRIVAATNRDLEAEVAGGRFREDLYYRLKVFPIRLPALRERREDIPILANHFLQRYSREFGKAIPGFSQQVIEALQSYSWPGNVRELENEVQRLVLQADSGAFVRAEHLSSRIRQVEGLLEKAKPTKGTLKERLEQVERWILSEVLAEHGNNKSAAAKTLGITREGLHKKLRAYGMN